MLELKISVNSKLINSLILPLILSLIFPSEFEKFISGNEEITDLLYILLLKLVLG